MLFNAVGFALAIAPLVAAAPQVIGAQCAADNCLRALRSSSRLEQARLDCAPHLVNTVTPPAVTETEFSTIHSTSTVVVAVTVDNTITETATLTVSETATIIDSITETVTLGIWDSAPSKRAEPVIPAYASACSGAARYTSACSCISATPVTTTLAALTTTVTIPTTVWATETETAEVTEDVHVTVPATTTVIGASTTISSILGIFYIRAIDGNEFVAINNDPTLAGRFELHSDGSVWVGDRTLMRYTGNVPNFVRLIEPRRQSWSDYAQFRCSIGGGQIFSCTIPNNDANTWATGSYSINGQPQRYNGISPMHASPQQYAANGNQYVFITMTASECIIDSHCSAGLSCQGGRCGGRV